MGSMSPFAVYVRLFAEASGQEPSRFSKRFTTHHVKSFNVRVSNWKTNNVWTNDQIAGLIFFCYFHNPLMAEDKRVYGSLDNIGQCVGLFSKWLKAHADLVDERGLVRCIIETAVDLDDDTRLKALDLSEARELYAKNRR